MLTLQFVPHMELEGLSSVKRINKLLKLVKSERILLVEGRLKPHEEAELIRRTMEEIDNKFKGIEISSVQPQSKDSAFFAKARSKFINVILGDRQGFTIIGPASVVKEIKQDPDKIQLFTTDKK